MKNQNPVFALVMALLSYVAKTCETNNLIPPSFDSLNFKAVSTVKNLLAVGRVNVDQISFVNQFDLKEYELHTEIYTIFVESKKQCLWKFE